MARSAKVAAAASVLALASVAVVLLIGQSEEEFIHKQLTDAQIVDRALDEMSRNYGKVKKTQKVQMKADKMANEGQIHKNIVEFKAYCVSAYDITDTAMAGAKHASIVPFILAFGKNARNRNIITEYGQLYAYFGNKFKRGLGYYILKRLNKAILYGKGVTTVVRGTRVLQSGQWIALNHRTLGLATRPGYLMRLAVRTTLYAKNLNYIRTNNAHADAFAAVQYLKGKTQRAYQSFLAREMAIVARHKNKNYRSVVKAAKTAEAVAYGAAKKRDPKAKLTHARIQTPAGKEAAGYVKGKITWKIPPMKVLIKRAAAKAKAYLAKMKAKLKSTKAIIGATERRAMGIRVTVTTGRISRAQSSMRPRITFVGTHGKISGRMRALPPQGKVFTQTFATSKRLGRLLKVHVHAGRRGSWFARRVQVRVGKTGPTLVMKQKNFWLRARSSRKPTRGYKWSHRWTLKPKH